MQPARLDLSIIQGATLRQILRVMQPELAYRPITAIASTSPVRLTVDHDLPTDWPVWIRGVTGMPALNREAPRALPHLSRVVDAASLEINALAATGFLPKGGELSYHLPVNLAGVTATLVVLDAAGGELLVLEPTVHAGGWVEVLLTDEQTAALTWTSGNWQLNLEFASGERYRAFAGAATVWPEGTVPSGTCAGGWVLAAGGQGVPGPMGPAFKVDAFGPLAERDQYDGEDPGFAFLATDNGLLYLREGAVGWTAGVPFQGPAGDDGRSIVSVEVNGAGHLIITYSDSSTSDAGAVPAAPAVWGAIGGVLLDQEDLATALAGKATAAQGAKADSAVQPDDLAPVATSGSYVDLIAKPFIPETAGDVGAATAAQGALAETAVQPAALAAGLDGKVDKVVGYGLSQEDFTPAEKAKLGALESSHFRGVFASVVALQAAIPTATPGDYADVDAGVGSDSLRYIWDDTDADWVLSGSGEPLTAAQIKSLYESNPDTNAFGDADKGKLDGIEAAATRNDDTDSLAEGATNLWFTAARVRDTMLTGLSLATNAAIGAADSVLTALGKLQRQLNDLTTSVAGKMANPMTTAGDLIVGGGSGSPQRLGAGPDGKVLKMVSGAPGWADELGGGGGVSSVNGQTGAVLIAQPNLLINGDFSINQRGFAGGALAAGSYGHDRWGAYNGGANYSVSGGVVTLTSGVICQVIETSGLSGLQVTVSVEDPSGTLTVAVGNGTGADSISGTITAGSGRRGVTLTVPAGVTGALKIRLSASGVTFRRAKVEAGGAATPWKAPARSSELLAARRYFHGIVNDTSGSAVIALAQGVDGGGGVGVGVFPFGYPAAMRAVPAVTVSGVTLIRGNGTFYSADTTLNGSTLMGLTTGKINLQLSVGAEGAVPNPTGVVLRNSSSYIRLDSELTCTD